MSTGVNDDQLVERLVPKILASIAAKAKPIETLPVQQDMSGVTSLPGYDTTGGQYKAVLIPIDNLKEPARTAGAAAEDAATKAYAAAAEVEGVVATAEQAVADAEAALGNATAAVNTANAAATNANNQATYAETAGRFATQKAEAAQASAATADTAAANATAAAETATAAAEEANIAAENAGEAYGIATAAQQTANEAKTTSNAAMDAIRTLQGLENSDEAMALIAEQIANIALNTQEINAIKASTVDCTLDEYEAWVEAGTIDASVEYNIYED